MVAKKKTAAKKKAVAKKKFITFDVPVSFDPLMFSPDNYDLEDMVSDAVHEQIGGGVREVAKPIAAAYVKELEKSGKLDKMVRAAVLNRIKSAV